MAVASRSLERAQQFLHGLPGAASEGLRACGSYEELVADPAIDAVYVALPNDLHRPWTLEALAAGKHVLCEKPMALDEAEATEMFAAAERSGRLLMEAFMYRAHEQTRELLRLVHGGGIGELRLIRANFTFARPAAPGDARYRPESGGGALMDVGCYCLDFARALARAEPLEAEAVFHRHESGIDDYGAGVLSFPDGEIASVTFGMTVASDQTSHLAGTEGRIEIPRFWFAEEGFSLHRPGEEPRHFAASEAARAKPVYATEADAFAEVLEGAPNWNPPENTLGNLRLIRRLVRNLKDPRQPRRRRSGPLP